MTASDGIVLVTGGSRGIGAAAAALLAQQGQRVVIVDIAPEALIGIQAILWPDPFDVASETGVVSGIAAIEAAHGPISGLVNAAGVFGKMHAAVRVHMDNWDREINIDLRRNGAAPACGSTPCLPASPAPSRWRRELHRARWIKTASSATPR